jgi:hypothetical protein
MCIKLFHASQISLWLLSLLAFFKAMLKSNYLAPVHIFPLLVTSSHNDGLLTILQLHNIRSNFKTLVFVALIVWNFVLYCITLVAPFQLSSDFSKEEFHPHSPLFLILLYPVSFFFGNIYHHIKLFYKFMIYLLFFLSSCTDI